MNNTEKILMVIAKLLIVIAKIIIKKPSGAGFVGADYEKEQGVLNDTDIWLYKMSEDSK